MIKNVSSTFKANCKKDSIKYREYIVIDNKEVDIKGNLSDTAYKGTTFFGKFNLKMLKFETENDIDYKKKEFTYYKEVDGEALKIGTFIVTDVSDSDTFESVNVTAYDYGLKFANPYKSTLNYKSNKITMFQVVQEICANCDIELENTFLPNGSFIVDSNQFVNREKYGDVICITALENGMFATINSNDKLEFIFTNETDEIIEDYVELDDKRDTQPITSVLVAPSEELATAGAVMKDQTLINQYGEHWLKIYDSYFANSTTKCQQLISAIFNQVKGFGYSSFKSEYSFLPYLTLGDKIKFKNKEGKLVNSVILRYETNYDEMILEAPSITNASVEYELPETPEETSKKALAKVDQANGEIELIAKATEELATKTAKLRLDVDTIEGQISDIADITTSGESQQALVNLVKINESEPIAIKIHPLIEDIAYLYPSEFLYPSDNLYLANRIIRFTNTKTNEIFDYKLPNDLLFYNSNNYDEFILNYDSKTCQVIKRVGYDKATNKNIMLPKEEIINYEYPAIILTEGDYTISLPGYSNGYLYVQLMASNIYTTQFATKVELTSSISQTKDEIDLEVSRKVGNDEIISKINQTPETITIQASKVNIGGVINAINNNTTTTINGDKITTGTLNADKVNGGTISGSSINLGNGKFTVNTNGIMNATSGSIAGWDIANSYLGTRGAPSDTVFMSRSGVKAYVDIAGGSPNCMFYAKGNFAIDENGTLYAENGYFRGNITGSTITGGSISIQKGNYYFNMGSSTSNPNCSGLNVGYYGIKAYSNITATGFAITDSDTGKSESFGIKDYHGHVHYLTFRGGILTKWEYK